jgi:polar amino acid transport system permease protein
MVTFDFLAVLSQWPLLLKGVVWTVGLTAVSAVIGVALGIACAWSRVYGGAWLRAVVGTYVELIRNTPFIVQLFFVFFGLPAAGIRLSPEAASIIAMVINLGAYAAEIIRAGIEATPRGQIEAALSLALTKAQTFLRVVLPPALGKVWPALVSQIIIVMLGSAVCGQISTEELSFAANLIQSRNFRAFEAFIIATAIYLALSVGLRKLLNWAGARFLFGPSTGSG